MAYNNQSKFAGLLLLLSLYLTYLTTSIEGHGRLIEPPSRASAWRYGFNTPPNYNDHELYCGGFARQQKNDGKCGVCGDPWDAPTPRAHEIGGTYGQGVIVRKYAPKSTITIRIELTANHNGFFEFRICPNYKDTTQECLDKNVLQLVRSVDQGGHRFYPRDGNKIYEMRYKLPDMTCDHCVLQWIYVAGNNWGMCSNGTGMVGCGPQEQFRSCADITITTKGPKTTEKPYYGPTTEVPEGQTPPTQEYIYSPLVSIIISLVAFLFTVLLLATLYIYYYEVGKRIKSCIKGNSKIDTLQRTPVPPPRIKRKTQDNNIMYSINLESVA